MKIFFRFCKSSLLVAILVCFVISSSAHAREKLFLTGLEGGAGDTENYYAYAGLVAPLFGERLGNGLVQRYWIDFLGYSYDTTETIDAQTFGLEGALGYQTSGSAGWAGAYLGLRYNNTSLSPDDPGNRNEGQKVWVKSQLEGQLNFADTWSVNGIASYTFGADAYWTRARLLKQLGQGLSTGPEAVYMGDPNYRAWQFGWVLTGFKPAPDAEIGIKVGVRITEHAGVNGLIGLEFVKLF